MSYPADHGAVFDRIKALLGEEGLEFLTEAAQPAVMVTPERLLDLARALKDDPELAFESLQQVTTIAQGRQAVDQIVIFQLRVVAGQ